MTRMAIVLLVSRGSRTEVGDHAIDDLDDDGGTELEQEPSSGRSCVRLDGSSMDFSKLRQRIARSNAMVSQPFVINTFHQLNHIRLEWNLMLSNMQNIRPKFPWKKTPIRGANPNTACLSRDDKVINRFTSLSLPLLSAAGIVVTRAR